MSSNTPAARLDSSAPRLAAFCAARATSTQRAVGRAGAVLQFFSAATRRLTQGQGRAAN